MESTALVLISHAGEHRARAFTPIANRPLLDHVLDSLEAAGVRELMIASDAALAATARELVAGRCRSFQARHFAAERLSLGGAVRAAEREFGPRPLLVHLADSLSRDLASLLPSEAPSQHDALVLVEEGRPPDTTVVNIDDCRPGASGSASLGPDRSPAGAALFGSAACAAAGQIAPGRSLDAELLALAAQLGGSGGRVEMRPVSDWFRLSGERGALLEGTRFALESIQREVPPGVLSEGSVAQGRVAIHPTAQLGATIVRGPAVIGAGARLADAYVGPYSAIGADVVIEGAEIEHSVVLPGARVSDLASRIEGSVIGENARVFRDFRLPSALRVQVGDGALVSVV
jgi:glucose-1-phosphate thymidylyltransferase